MLRHVCVVSLTLVLTLNLGGLLVQEAQADDHGWNNREVLHTFDYESLGSQDTHFVMPFDPADPDRWDFDRYVFELHAHSFPLGGPGISVFHIEVVSLQGDTMCSGAVGNAFGLGAHLYCDELRPGHHYDITIVGILPADLTLSGVNPIGP